jgi:putative tricarboxylic transport membrane protein
MRMTEERWGGLVFLIGGVYGLIFSLELPFGKWNEPGAAAFPLGVSILLVVFALLLLALGKGAVREGGKIGWREHVRKNRDHLVKAMVILALLAGFILFLETLGYLLTSTIFAFLILILVSRYRIGIAICFALVIGVGSWLFFGELLSVQFPMGLLPF